MTCKLEGGKYFRDSYACSNCLQKAVARTDLKETHFEKYN